MFVGQTSRSPPGTDSRLAGWRLPRERPCGGIPVCLPVRWVLTKDPSGKLDPKAFLCTDLQVDPIDVLRCFVRRWAVEVTFEETRRHLGVETQRQWSDLAILRTTPCLLGLFSIVALMADRLEANGGFPLRLAA